MKSKLISVILPLAVVLGMVLVPAVPLANVALANPDYNLTVDITGNGNVTANGTLLTGYPNTTSYPDNEVVTINATADANYHFVDWTGDTGTIDDPNAANTTINMTGNYSIVANFAIDTYNLTTNSTDGGNVTVPGEGTYSYDYGTVVNLVATPDDGYYFVNWTGNTGTIADPNAATTTITMNDNYSITANFGWLPVVEKKKVVEPAAFSASYLHVSPPQVSPNQAVEVSVNVANSGGQSGSRAVILYVNGKAEQSQTVSVAPGSSQNVVFTVTRATPGTYNVLVEGQSGQFAVRSTSVFGGGGLGTGGIIAIIVVLLALIVGIIFVMRGAPGGA